MGKWWPEPQAAVVGLVGKHFVLDADAVTRRRAIEMPSKAEHLVFEADAWEPAMMRWAEWKARVLERFRKTLADHRATIEKRAADAGMVRTERRREEHLIWLARYQVGNDGMDTLARKLRVPRSTLEEAVRVTAALVGITPPRRVGRPRRQK